MKKKINDLIIFDLDGTLIDSREDLTTVVNLLRAEYNLSSVSLETVTGFIGNGARKLVERALPEGNADIDEALAIYKSFYMEHMLDKTSLYPGVKSGLEFLFNAGYKLALVTNKPAKACLKVMEKLEVDIFFSMILGADSGCPLKPDPASIYYVIDKTRSSTDVAWMVGDNYTDLEAGRRAGVKTCFAEYGFGDPGKESYDFSVDSFPALVEFFLDM